MNNLDSRCPPIVNVEVHFNHFMEIIAEEWSQTQDNPSSITDYEFTPIPNGCGFKGWDKEAFHKLINDEYVDFLNQVVIHPKDYYELSQEMWDTLRDEFSNWVDEKWITIIYENENENENEKEN